MARFRIIEKGGVFYVEATHLGLLWTKIGKPSIVDGGWAGPEKFKDIESAREWVRDILKAKEKNSTSSRVVEYING